MTSKNTIQLSQIPLSNILDQFPSQTILGLGDLMLDVYHRGHAVGLSPEAPAIDLLNPTAYESPGGAANVAWNIGHLGGRVKLLGIVGNDQEAASLTRLLSTSPGVQLEFIEDSTRPTVLKARYYHEQYQLLRVTHESRTPLSSTIIDRCIDTLIREAKHASALFVEDYGKGIVTGDLIDALIHIRNVLPDVPLLFDPKIGNHLRYKPRMCSLLKPNWLEASRLLGFDTEQSDFHALARALSEKFESAVLITLGSHGSVYYDGHSTCHVPTRPRETFDVAGAGDTTLAAATLSLSAGASLLETALISNAASGCVVQKSGTAHTTSFEILEELRMVNTVTIETQSAIFPSTV